jgi:hypothetical protein
VTNNLEGPENGIGRESSAPECSPEISDEPSLNNGFFESSEKSVIGDVLSSVGSVVENNTLF